MLDALKFAFEILIVGTLALPWLAVLIKMFPSSSTSDLQSFLSFLPDGAKDAVNIAAVIAFGYFLGSAVSRFSRDFFNDEVWRPFPTEDIIRDGVYFDEFCTAHADVYKDWKQDWKQAAHLEPPADFCFKRSQDHTPSPQRAITFSPCKHTSEKAKPLAPSEPATSSKDVTTTHPGERLPASFTDFTQDDTDVFDERVQEVFRLQESELLLEGTDKVDRLKQYFDQITVLRGAAFNGTVLFALCVIGSLGYLYSSWSAHPVLRLVTFIPPIIMLLYVVISLICHLYSKDKNFYSDPPLAELVILLIGALGVFAIPRGKHSKSYFLASIGAVVVTAVSFGGWWWTEVTYDTYVIHAEPELSRHFTAITPDSPKGKDSAASTSDASPAGARKTPVTSPSPVPNDAAHAGPVPKPGATPR